MFNGKMNSSAEKITPEMEEWAEAIVKRILQAAAGQSRDRAKSGRILSSRSASIVFKQPFISYVFEKILVIAK